MQISGLSASNSFSATDVLAIEVNVNGVEKTYKLTGATLATALASIGSYLKTTDVVNNLTSTSTTAPLSANMGKELNEAIAQSTAKVVKHTAIATTNSNGIVFTDIPISTIAWGFVTDTYPCITGFYEGEWFLLVANSVNGAIVPLANALVTYFYYTFEYGV